MTTLVTMQRYAEKCAEKLGVTDTVKLRWHGGECKMTRADHLAHCHVCRRVSYTNPMPRGTICIRPGTWTLTTVKHWRMLIAHEVAHLATDSSHSSVTFARRMMLLGQATHKEEMRVRRSRKHKHVYSHTVVNNGKTIHQCCVCYKIKPIKT